MNTILVVSDYPIVLEGLHKVLARRRFRVLKANTAAAALDLLSSNENIKLILVDLSLKEDNQGKENNEGLLLVEQVRRRGLQQPVVIYAMQDSLNQILAIEESNVKGVVLKTESIQELINAVRSAETGVTFRSEGFEQRIKEAKKMRRLISAKDREVLRRLTTGEANRDIAVAMGLSEKTVEYHRSNILKKLGARSMFEATRRALHLGIID